MNDMNDMNDIVVHSASHTKHNGYQGEIAIDGDKVLVWSDNGNGWMEMAQSKYATTDPTTEQMKIDAQKYLKSLGITEDIDSILANKYPQHLI